MARRTDALGEAWGPDGTQPSSGTDALRAPDAGSDATGPSAPTRPTGPSGTVVSDPTPPVSTGRSDEWERDALPPLPIPRLPPMPTVDHPASHTAIERWMDDDHDAHRDDPPPAPYRVLRPTRPASPPARRITWDDDDAVAATDGGDQSYEDPTTRAQREEREFEAQFGRWRADAPPPMRRSTLVSPPVLLLVIVLLVVLYFSVIH